jgi:ABC-type uncharacterized transport system involved in gliding motility auxiliary subunit
MATSSSAVRVAAARVAERGSVSGLTLHVVLVLLVLGQIVYLASRHRVRVDLTSDQLWTSTESTRTLVDKLDKRLVVEAYFSPKDKLPVAYRESRAWAESFLDELVQIGKGKVVLQRFDPNADKAVADKANRVGVKFLDLENRSATSLSFDRHWQGLRLLYGGGKQRVIAQWTPRNSFEAEAIVTPVIKEVMTETKPKLGYMEWPATNPGGPQQGGIGWGFLRTLEGIAKRYDFQNFKDEDAPLLPPDLGTLFLFRPKDLTDRQKYVLDQFVVRGGTLVAFVDAAEYLIGPQRSFTRMPLSIDAAGSQHKFTDQLLHYGLDWRPKVVADMERLAHTPNPQTPYEFFAVQTQLGLRAIAYPYFFHPVAVDWRQAADQLAKDDTGKIDKDLADQYRRVFVPGMPTSEFVLQQLKQKGRGPGFYWPTWVGLRERAGGVADLPDGVTGKVMLWSSPLALLEDPPQNLNPLTGSDARQKQAEYEKLVGKLTERLKAEPRQQAPLMVEVTGTFSSFFANGEAPKRPSQIREEEARKNEAQPKVDDPSTPADESKPPAEGPQPAPDKPKQDTPSSPAEPAMLKTAVAPGRILLIGDSDFLRDDVVRDNYRIGGPSSVHVAGGFFPLLLDWLARDSDLVALFTKEQVDRRLKFVDTMASTTDPRVQEQVLRRKTTWLRALNVLVPVALLSAFGLVVFFVRRAQKRTFLASLN